jgi:hypothetical protein
MAGPYQQLADPNAIADAGQFANSPELWKALMALDAQRQTDQLVPPPRNPAAPADWAANAVRGAAGKLADIVTLPGRAMQQGITTEEAVPWATDTALNLAGGGAPMAERGAAGAFGGRLPTFEGPIRAYHSSPHDFEQFDLGKIGTGEGAQTYGHGIYAAENPAVSGQGGEYWKNFTSRLANNTSSEGLAHRYLIDTSGDRAAAIERAQTNLDHVAARPHMYVDEQRQAIAGALEVLKSPQRLGARTYEIGINARPEQMLNWDETMAPKTPIREMLADVGMKGTGSPYANVRNVSKDAFLAAQNPNLTGEGAYRSLARAISPEGFRPFNALASKQLNEAGIPGIRYLDQGSRTPLSSYSKPQLQDNLIWQRNDLARMEKEGMAEPALARQRERISSLENQIRAIPDPTHNYVIFDPKKIDIYRKYGMAGAVPAAGAAAYSQQDNR